MNTNTVSFQWRWLVPNQVMLVSIPETVVATQITDFMAEFIHALESIAAPNVHVIYDASAIRHLPGTVREYINAALDLTMLPGHGWAFMTGANAAVMLVLTVYINLNGARVRAFKTNEEAWAFLRGIVPELATEYPQ
jgi:hypothetical protein